MTQPPTLEAGRGVVLLAIAFLAVGTLARVAPLADQDGRVLRQFPTEDGYLMLTIARNMALGHGMSVQGGLQQTNGTQPLTTGIWALGFQLVDGDRQRGVEIALWLQVLFSAATAYGIWRLARFVLAGQPYVPDVAWLAASAWYVSPVALPHSMNCLETSLVGLLVVVIAFVYLRAEPANNRAWTVSRCVGFGALLGVAFWARNDSTFLILGLCLTHLALALPHGAAHVRRRFLETLLFGGTSVAVAAPWLVSNFIRFGHVMPISGVAESLFATFGTNVRHAPTVLLEYLMVIVPIPQSVQSTLLATAGAVVVLLALAPWAVAGFRRTAGAARVFVLVTVAYAASLVLFYSLYFGAGWFVNRYFYPLSPLLAILTVQVMVKRLPASVGLRSVVAVACLVLVCGLNVRFYARGAEHAHFGVVDWVSEHVPEGVLVAAPQTGTLGFFHDATINLDGKVNPEALAALEVEVSHMDAIRRGERPQDAVIRYAIEKDVDYLADWIGLAFWQRYAVTNEYFDLIVQDPVRNVAVFKRKRD